MVGCEMVLKNPLTSIGLAAVLLLVGGCTEDISIRTYTVPKSEANRDEASAPVSSGRPLQSMAAAIPNGNNTWFFKLQGEPAKVSQAEAAFKELVLSVKFDPQGNPTWNVPSGWTEQPSQDGFSHSSLRNQELGLSATISQLVVPPETSWQSWIEQNVNRWRRQVSLPEQTWTELEPTLTKLESLSESDRPAYYINLTGTGASGQRPPMMGGIPPMQPNRSISTQVKYKVPLGWIETPGSGMRLATFRIDKDGQQAEVTLISAGGDKRSNVERWQKQLIPSADKSLIDFVIQSAEKVEVNGIPSELYYIKGEDGPEQGAFLAAIIDWQPGNSLFVKFNGPAKVAESEREAFSGFVKSIVW
jgi:hypothetical protein